MDRSVYVTEEDLKRLSTITEYTEDEGSTSDDGDDGDGEEEADLEDDDVKYFLVDDSPMAKFSRSVKWAYKKVSIYIYGRRGGK